MSNSNKIKFDNKQFFEHYQKINTCFIDIYKKNYQINKQDLMTYLDVTKIAFIEIYDYLLNEILKPNKIKFALTLDKYKKELDKHMKEIAVNVQDVVPDINQDEILPELEIVNVDEILLEGKTNEEDEEYTIKKEKESDDEYEIKKESTDMDIEESDSDNTQIKKEKDSSEEEDTDPDDNSFKRRVYVLKTDNDQDKEEVVEFLQKTYLNWVEAFYVKSYNNNDYYFYYFYVRFHNPIIFPFKGKEHLSYTEKRFSNNNIKKILKSKGNYHQIKKLNL